MDPLTLAAISGISTVGGVILGKITNRKSKQEEFDTSIFENLPQNEIQFLAVKENINPKLVLDYVHQGKTVFVNTRQLNSNKKLLVTFLDNLSEASNASGLRINQVAKDMIFITSVEQEVLVETLTSASNQPRRLDLDDIQGS